MKVQPLSMFILLYGGFSAIFGLFLVFLDFFFNLSLDQSLFYTFQIYLIGFLMIKFSLNIFLFLPECFIADIWQYFLLHPIGGFTESDCIMLSMGR